MKSHINTKSELKLFRKVGITTLVAVYLLVLAGGIVRSTGSGMGCPDWPKCFGSWVPPTEVSQLPLHYKETYAQKRIQKNERLSKYLDQLGWTTLSEKIRNNPLGGEEAAFNATKTWIEYVNRLLGVIVGLLIFATLVVSIRIKRTEPGLFYLSLLNFVLVGFQGWIGSVVVSTNLLPGTITVHMLLAIAIILILIYTIIKSYKRISEKMNVTRLKSLNKVVMVAMTASVLQILFGTQVREGIDQAVQSLGLMQKHQWIDSLGLSFYIHRSFSLVIMGIHLYLIYQLRQQAGSNSFINTSCWVLLSIVALEILTGVVMAYFNIPAFMQPTHLFLAIVIVGIQFTVLLVINQKSILGKISREEPALGTQARLQI
jgi:heme a synthase